MISFKQTMFLRKQKTHVILIKKIQHFRYTKVIFLSSFQFCRNCILKVNPVQTVAADTN